MEARTSSPRPPLFGLFVRSPSERSPLERSPVAGSVTSTGNVALLSPGAVQPSSSTRRRSWVTQLRWIQKPRERFANDETVSPIGASPIAAVSEPSRDASPRARVFGSISSNQGLHMSVSPTSSMSCSNANLCASVSGSAQPPDPTGDGSPARVSQDELDDAKTAGTMRVPLYMFCLDLAFAATFSVCSQIFQLSRVDDDFSIPRFFATFLPVAWLWDHTNRHFNRFDQEDLISELTVIVLMSGAMALALNLRACFFADELDAPEQDVPTRDSCLYVASAYGTMRAVLSLLTLYVSAFVPSARRLLRGEAMLWLLLAPSFVLFAINSQLVSNGLSDMGVSLRFQLLLVVACAVDVLITLRDEMVLPMLSWLSPRCWAPRLKGCDLALEGRYAIMPNERMIIISIGNICLNATKEAFLTLPAFDWRGVAMCAATPWAAFLIKVFYFDLFQIDPEAFEGAGRHATEISKPRAAVWSLSHLPMLGTILWIAVSLTKLLMPVPRVRAPHGHWHLAAAFSAYLALGTLQQCLHQGSGRGSRRCGRRRRLMIRTVFLAMLLAAQFPLVLLVFDDDLPDAEHHHHHHNPSNSTVQHQRNMQSGVTAAVDLALLTALAAVELAGMRLVAEDADEEAYAVNVLRAGGRPP